jgi:serine/threonine-protein kinase RsbT
MLTMHYKQFQINKDTDVLTLINIVKYFAAQQQASDITQTEIVTICSELTYNVVKYANQALLELEVLENKLTITCSEQGEGFQLPLENAFIEGKSTAGSLGLGLASIMRMCDDFQLCTNDNGTSIICTKAL